MSEPVIAEVIVVQTAPEKVAARVLVEVIVIDDEPVEEGACL